MRYYPSARQPDNRTADGSLAAHIAEFKVPQYVAVTTAPALRNPGGKLLRRRLRTDTDWDRRRPR